MITKIMTKKDPKNAENAGNFTCKICDFVCSKVSNYKKHTLTLKHKNNDDELHGIFKNAKK